MSIEPNDVDAGRSTATSYRYCCPYGHVSLTHHANSNSYYCGPCGQWYEGSPIDKKHEEIPHKGESR